MTTVLIVDDSKFSRSRAVAALEPCGYTLVEAADGQAGLEAAAACSPDVVVTDLRMPILDGAGLMDGLRRRGLNVPVIVLSADNTSSVQERCLKSGPCEFLKKPFQADDLAELVRDALAVPV